jgi:hypothetical protein
MLRNTRPSTFARQGVTRRGQLLSPTVGHKEHPQRVPAGGHLGLNRKIVRQELQEPYAKSLEV